MRRRALALLAPLAIAASASCGRTPTATTDDAGVEQDASGLPAPCSLAPAGDPVAIVSFDTRHATAPSMAVVDDGASSAAASVAIAVFANAGTSGLPDDVELARARVAADPPWPGGATLDEPPILQGEFAIGGGRVATAGGNVGLAWHRDTAAVGRPQFRPMVVSSWTQGANANISDTGETMISFASGGGAAEGGGWSGEGFAVSWRDVGAPGVGPARPIGAFLDPNGAVRRGPSPLATAEDYPGRSPVLAWTGSEWLVATSYDACLGGIACAARSVVVYRIVAAGDASSAFSLEAMAVFASSDPSLAPGSAAIASLGGRAWVGWFDGPPGDAGTGVLRTARVASVDSRGRQTGDPIVVDPSAHPTTRMSLSAGDAGLLLSWAEDGPLADAGDTQPSASFVVVRRVGWNGTVDAPVRIAATRVDDLSPPTTATIQSPRGALVLWAGRSPQPTHFDVAFLARLDCAP